MSFLADYNNPETIQKDQLLDISLLPDFISYVVFLGGIILSYMHCKHDQKRAYTNLIQQQRKYI